jgi:two-component system response regulator NreC
MIRILIVDDQAATRKGLRMLLSLENDLDVVGEAEDGAAGVAYALATAPDVVLMDIAMPGLDGITATADLHSLLPTAAVIVLTLHDDPQTREHAYNAGASAVLGKHEGDAALLAAIRGVRE